jgi:hypothetical protein
MIVPDGFPEQVIRLSYKVNKVTKIFMDVKKYFVENINKTLGTIMEALEISIKAVVMMGRVCSLKEFSQKDLQIGEHFYKNAISTFNARISSMEKLTIWKQDFQSKNRLKQIQVG